MGSCMQKALCVYTVFSLYAFSQPSQACDVMRLIYIANPQYGILSAYNPTHFSDRHEDCEFSFSSLDIFKIKKHQATFATDNFLSPAPTTFLLGSDSQYKDLFGPPPPSSYRENDKEPNVQHQQRSSERPEAEQRGDNG